MAEIKKIYDDAARINQVYPQTHERAVVDNNGTTAETKFKMITDLVNQKQMEIGAVPGSLSPKAEDSGYVTGGGLFNALYDENFTRIDLPSQTFVNFNLENSTTWVANNTYKGVLFSSSGIYALKLVASSYKCDICLLTNNTINAGQTPNYCSGTTKIHVESGNVKYVNIPSDCNYVYVYVSNGSSYDKFSVLVNDGNTNFASINGELLSLQNDFENSKALANLKGWSVGTVDGNSRNILFGYAGRLATVCEAQVLEYVVEDGYSVSFNEYSGKYSDIYKISGSTWIQGSGWFTGSGTFYPTSSTKTIVVTLSKNPTSSNLTIVSSDGVNFSYYYKTPIYKLDEKINDINSSLEEKEYFEILHQSGRFPTKGIGTIIADQYTRDGMNKIFTVEELSRYRYIQMPDGFLVAINQANILTSTNDYINYGWLGIDDGLATIPTLNVNYQYCVLTFRREDNGTVTTTDTETLNASVRLITFPSVQTQDEVVSDVFKYSGKNIFDSYAYRNAHQYLHQPVFELADLHTHGLANSIQSECWIDATRIMVFSTGTTYAIYDILTDTYVSKTKPETGHCNDVTLVGNIMYVNGSSALNGQEESKLLYSWDLETNTATPIDTSAITDGSVGMRVIGGVAKKDDNNLYLVCFDYTGNTNQPSEKLLVYNYAISTGDITLLFQLDWVGWFVQGSAYANNGLLYVATNQPPSGSTYTGVAIWCIDVNTGTLLDKLMIDGNFEPQGLQLQVYGFKAFLDFGLTKYGYTTKLLRTEVF